MKTKTFTAAAALALAVAAMPAMALTTSRTGTHGKHDKQNGAWSQKQRAQFEQQFTRFDRNGDGIVTRAEFPADATLFDQLDLNRDGGLTRSEVAQALPDRSSAERLARGYDRNGDGVISRNEFPGNDNAFNRLDRNGDGVLSQADDNGRGHGRGNGKAKGHGRNDR